MNYVIELELFDRSISFSELGARVEVSQFVCDTKENAINYFIAYLLKNYKKNPNGNYVYTDDENVRFEIYCFNLFEITDHEYDKYLLIKQFYSDEWSKYENDFKSTGINPIDQETTISDKLKIVEDQCTKYLIMIELFKKPIHLTDSENIKIKVHQFNAASFKGAIVYFIDYLLHTFEEDNDEYIYINEDNIRFGIQNFYLYSYTDSSSTLVNESHLLKKISGDELYQMSRNIETRRKIIDMSNTIDIPAVWTSKPSRDDVLTMSVIKLCSNEKENRNGIRYDFSNMSVADNLIKGEKHDLGILLTYVNKKDNLIYKTIIFNILYSCDLETAIKNIKASFSKSLFESIKQSYTDIGKNIIEVSIIENFASRNEFCIFENIYPKLE